MFRFLLVALLCAMVQGFSFAPATSVVQQQSTVAMSTRFTDPFVQKMKKKNPKTGSTKQLKGYTVGSRAPVVAKKSGTTIDQTRAGKYAGAGELRGVDKNTQNVPTAVVLGLPALAYFVLSAIAK